MRAPRFRRPRCGRQSSSALPITWAAWPDSRFVIRGAASRSSGRPTQSSPPACCSCRRDGGPGWATDFVHAWTTRTVSNAIAMLTIVPSVVLLWPYVRDKRVQSFPRIVEFGVLLVGLILVQAAVLPIGNTDLGLFIALYAPMP